MKEKEEEKKEKQRKEEEEALRKYKEIEKNAATKKR